ncbi:hypothetical protein OO006_05405 [Prosthecochloris sp. SCSIO W1101]|uniref:hypothetical protein n=1 Tax=Prosthecochloris sp. SCSIO W1101 TaxID=2992242 RepID=UPI00223E2838|nr:hypothetical protein [Prosthecochloris sp. SCSIO W1101]UZJ42395.1 hypothetical protein OO006_05405 [Prosthecochloris sp. SCSIO W1101]
MSMMTILLLIILMLLVFILAMMFTVLPKRQHAEIEKAVSALRREMAEYRGDSMRLMQAIRNEVEEAVQESLDREVADFMRGRGRSAVPSACSDTPVSPACEGKSDGLVKEGKTNVQGQGGTVRCSRQLSLFEQTGPVAPVSSAEKEKMDKKPDVSESEEMERIHVIIDDDIPDIDDIPDLEDIK